MGTFKGIVTKVTLKQGTSAKGDWANASVEVTEENPNNPEYPQVGLFDLFKNGEHIKYALEFEKNNPIGTVVEVEYNHKKQDYTDRQGNEKSFYSTPAWKIQKVVGATNTQQAETFVAEGDDDLPF